MRYWIFSLLLLLASWGLAQSVPESEVLISPTGSQIDAGLQSGRYESLGSNKNKESVGLDSGSATKTQTADEGFFSGGGRVPASLPSSTTESDSAQPAVDNSPRAVMKRHQDASAAPDFSLPTATIRPRSN